MITVFNLHAFIADKISDTAYKKVTATIVQNEILLSPQTVFLELDELEDLLLLDFVVDDFLVAIYLSSYI